MAILLTGTLGRDTSPLAMSAAFAFARCALLPGTPYFSGTPPVPGHARPFGYVRMMPSRSALYYGTASIATNPVLQGTACRNPAASVTFFRETSAEEASEMEFIDLTASGRGG
jgi:hypothetical protein